MKAVHPKATRLAVCTLSLVGLAGCAGSGGSGTPHATFRIAMPCSVSPGPSLVIKVNTVNGSAVLPSGTAGSTTVPLTSSNLKVDSTGVGVATVTLPAPTGIVNYTFNVQSSLGDLLATAPETLAVSKSSSQNFNFALGGVVKFVDVVAPTLQKGSSFSGPLTVQAYAANMALISGPYSAPFNLAVSDPPGNLSFTDGAVTAQSVSVVSAADVVIVNFDGSVSGTFPVTAQGGTVPAGGGDPRNANGYAGVITVSP